jgi:hypothetical protein
MTLNDIVGNTSVSIETIASDRDLAREIQNRLTVAGLLDPPADGMFGAVSLWALTEFCKAKGLDFDLAVTSPIAASLLDDGIATLFPVNPGNDLAGKIVAALQRRGYFLARHPDCLNIVYLEGTNADGTKNANTPNQFNDLRTLIQIGNGGTCRLVHSWEGTTEPGRYWTEHPMDPKGAARIKFGQYKSWSVGTHHAGSPAAHEALVQVADIVVYRDRNQTFKREGSTYTGVFAVNQHWGYDMPKTDLGKSSAGCLVGRSTDGHKAFMSAIKSDLRYQTNHGYRFVTAVLPPGAIDETVFDPAQDH